MKTPYADLSELFDLLASEVNSAYTKTKLFDQLYDDKNLPLLDRVAPPFFTVVQEILFDDLVLTIAKLTDPPVTSGKPNLTFARLVQMIDMKQHAQLHAEAANHLCSLEACADALRLYRNKCIAHNDLQTCCDTTRPAGSPKELFTQAGLPHVGLSSIDQVFEIAEGLMSAVSEHFTGKPFRLQAQPHVQNAVGALVALLGGVTGPTPDGSDSRKG